MANSISARASLRLDCVIDSDSTIGTGTPLTMVCNRQMRVVDYLFNVSAVSAVGDGAILIEQVTSAGVATTLATVVAQGAVTAAQARPGVVTLTPGTTNGLAAGAAVGRLSTLRVRGFATPGADSGGPIRATGTICALPGDRYAAGASTSNYYPNNPAANRFST